MSAGSVGASAGRACHKSLAVAVPGKLGWQGAGDERSHWRSPQTQFLVGQPPSQGPGLPGAGPDLPHPPPLTPRAEKAVAPDKRVSVARFLLNFICRLKFEFHLIFTSRNTILKKFLLEY